MTIAFSAAAFVVLINAFVSLAARRWTLAGDAEARWGKAQAVSAVGRFVFIVLGLWAVWRWTGAAGPSAAYIMVAAVGQTISQIFLLNRNKI